MKTLNIKNPEVYELASELAKLMDVSMTEAVKLSLENKLKEVKPKKPTKAEIDDFLEKWRANIDLDGIRQREAELYDYLDQE